MTGSIEPWPEALLAEMTEIAYCAGLRHGIDSAFADVELKFHGALRERIDRQPDRHDATPRLWHMRPGWRA